MEENHEHAASIGNRRYLNHGEDIDLGDPAVIKRLEALDDLITDVEQRTGQKFDAVVGINGEYGYMVMPHMDPTQPSQLFIGTHGWLAGNLEEAEGILLHEAGHVSTRNALALNILHLPIPIINQLDLIQDFMRVDPQRAHGWLLEKFGSMNAAEEAIALMHQAAGQRSSLMQDLEGKSDREIFQLLRKDPTYLHRAAEQIDTEPLMRLYTDEALDFVGMVTDISYQNRTTRSTLENVLRISSPELLDTILKEAYPLRSFENAPLPDEAFLKLSDKLAVYKDAAIPVLAARMSAQRAEEYLVDHFALQHTNNPEAYFRSLAAMEHAEGGSRDEWKAQAAHHDIDLSTHPLIPDRIALGREHVAEFRSASVDTPAHGAKSSLSPKGMRAAAGAVAGMGLVGVAGKVGEHGTLRGDLREGGTRAVLALASTGADGVAVAADGLEVAGKVKGFGGALARRALPVAVVAGGLEVGTAIAAKDGYRAAEAAGATAGGILAGMAAGAATGAVIGTVVPVAGNVAGFVIGGVVGLASGVAGAYYGGKAARELGGQALDNKLNDDLDRKLDGIAAQLQKSGYARMLDSDRDGKIEAHEIRQYIGSDGVRDLRTAASDGLSTREVQTEIVQQLSKNYDRQLTAMASELERKNWKPFLDKDGDGKIELPEIRQVMKQYGIKGSEVDANHDGRMTPHELTSAMMAHGVNKPATGR